ncbi:MAG: hypothetical protein H6895_08160 [Defluviimonas sp.]|nr:hypothetical protein [Paracoccaceae bacterium]MCC0064045.1 hypothetical protein [Defluviimonas sp.]
MLRLLKLVLFLAVATFVAATSFAYLGDMTPARTDVTQPVELNVGQ